MSYLVILLGAKYFEFYRELNIKCLLRCVTDFHLHTRPKTQRK